MLFTEKIGDGKELGEKFLSLNNIELYHTDILSDKIIERSAESIGKIKNFYILNSLKETLLPHLKMEAMMYKAYNELLNLSANPNFKIIIQGIYQNKKIILKNKIFIVKN